KVTTPESVMDKPTKLSAIFDRIHLVEQRFELLKKQAEADMLRKQIEALKSEQSDDAIAAMEIQHQAQLQQWDDDLEFLKNANLGGEFMTPEHQQRIKDIALHRIINKDGELVPFLSEE